MQMLLATSERSSLTATMCSSGLRVQHASKIFWIQSVKQRQSMSLPQEVVMGQ